jgi:hypothetical protein
VSSRLMIDLRTNLVGGILSKVLPLEVLHQVQVTLPAHLAIVKEVM